MAIEAAEDYFSGLEKTQRTGSLDGLGGNCATEFITKMSDVNQLVALLRTMCLRLLEQPQAKNNNA